MRKPKLLTRWEALAIGIVAVALLAWCFFPKSGGGRVEVTQKGAPVLTRSLSANGTVRLEGAHGMNLTLVIADGAAWVEDAGCPDRLCARHKPISKAGESIVCLPGQIVITVKGGDSLGPDAVSG